MKKTAAVFTAVLLILAVVLPVSAEDTSAYLYKNQLQGNETALYDVILTNFKSRTTPFKHTFTPPLTFKNASEVQSGVQTMAFRAFEAVYRDCPEIFWISKSGIGVSSQGAADTEVSGLDISAVYIDGSNAAKKQNRLDAAVSGILAKADGTDYEKVKAFHDTLTANCSYDKAAQANPSVNPDAYDAYGALVGGKAVCEGYSKAFKLLCDKAGIPCVIIGGMANGGPHMWNYVMLGDSYYFVDVTFDDPIGGEPGYEYFLKGDTVKDHKPGGGFLQNFDSKFKDPVLSKTDFDPKKDNTSSSSAKKKESCRVIVSDSKGGQCLVSYSGAGALDRGQIVMGGVVLAVSATPQPGYALKEIRVRMGSQLLTESKSKVFYFTVTDDCKVSAIFEPV